MRTKSSFLIAVFIALAITVVVLVNHPNGSVWPGIDTLPDLHFFSMPECRVACWQSLRPGETTTDQLMAFFKQKVSTNFKVSAYGPYTLYVVPYQEKLFINAVVSQDLLVSIQLSGYSNLTLDKVARTLGSPPYVRYSYGPAPDRSVELQVTLYYPNDGFVFDLQQGSGLSIQQESDDRVSICLKQDAVISLVAVSSPGTINQVISTQALPFTDLSASEVSSQVARLSTWPGFKCVSQPWPER